ncbi:alpha/beta fold hydrolase [Bacteroides fluxus]|uniref:alpha/beta hydrolase n=1 Tax=Bacteroides fluxus TaxID=626930 RepID=UPI003977CDE5
MMRRIGIIYRWLFLLGFLLGNVYEAFAQDADMARARHIYEWFVAGRGDSIHAALNKDLQEKLAPVVFNDTFRQTERTFGKLKSEGDWQRDSAAGITIHYRDLEFERYSLRFIVAFDADGRMNTIRLAPVPAVSTAKPVTYDDTKISEKDIAVGADGFKLPGTLTMPKFAAASGMRRVPCVILVHGSGPNDRDETVGPNKPFRDLAWGLAERGVAVIRYDKRTKIYGMNCVPAGRVLNYDTEAVDDALAAILQARTLPEIAADSIYVLGHSLGGTLAPRIAERSEGLAGIIVLAGLARPLEDALEEQFTYISSLTDSSANAGTQLAELKRQLVNVKKLGTDAFDDKIPLPLGQPRSYWEFANEYKPVEVAAKLKLPIFVLQGERDYQVTMEDFGLWRFGLLRCKNVFFKSYPKLNHLLQEGSGKATPFEYNRASPVPAYVMDDIASFVKGKRALP